MYVQHVTTRHQDRSGSFLYLHVRILSDPPTPATPVWELLGCETTAAPQNLATAVNISEQAISQSKRKCKGRAAPTAPSVAAILDAAQRRSTWGVSNGTVTTSAIDFNLGRLDKPGTLQGPRYPPQRHFPGMRASERSTSSISVLEFEHLTS